jgi:diguanylate cyclase (GGDEF)-like protein
MTADRRMMAAVAAAALSLVVGVGAVVADLAVLGAVAGLAGAVSGALAYGLALQLRSADERIARAELDRGRLEHELDASAALLDEQMQLHAEAAGEAATAKERAEQAFDPATGLYEEKHFAVLVQQQVAAARRSLRPIAVVIFEIDGLIDAESDTREQALAVVGDVVRRTLRESDSACRLGDLMIGAILEDTPEAGGVWAAERIRGTLLGSPIGDAVTVSAGVACYPSHALGAAELVAQAGKALETARERGADRVEVASEP